MPTIYDIASTLHPLDTYKRGPARVTGRALPFITDGLTPKKAPLAEGLHNLSVEQVLSLIVPTVSLNGNGLHGFQRSLKPAHARSIAREMLAGTPFPPIIVALDGKRLSITEGQHRAIGAVLANLPLSVLVMRHTKDQQRQLFAGQRRAATVDANVLILAANGPYERYIQAAVTTNSHPWHDIVSAHGNSPTKISPHLALDLLTRFVHNAEGNAAISTRDPKRWNEHTADSLAPLIRCFGDKAANPLAYQAVAIRAIAGTAMWVFRRNEPRESNRDRWLVHMPKFAFDRHTYIRTQTRMTDELLAHWNKRLSAENRIAR